MEFAIVIIELIVSIIWIQQGIVKYGFWVDRKPAGGFVPIIFAVIVLVVSIVVLIRLFIGRKKTGTSQALHGVNYIPAIGAIGGAFMIQVLGIAAAVFFFSTIWMRYLSKYTWLKSVFASALFTLFIVGVFRWWLRVPFPSGYVFGWL